MIEFKKVCENFNTVFINAKESSQTIFLNASLELVRDPSQQASVAEIISALQQRVWIDSTTSPNETEECMQKIWEQTQFIYADSFESSIRTLEPYHKLLDSSIPNPSDLSAKRKACEEFLKMTIISCMKKAASSPVEEPILPILQILDDENEKMGQQVIALKNAEIFDTLLYLETYDKNEFLSVFIEELNGELQGTFPKLLEIYELTKKVFINKKKHKHSAHSHRHPITKTKKNISATYIREKLLKILEKAPLLEIDIPILDKLKFVLLKNSTLLCDVGFRECYSVIKEINTCIDEIEIIKKKYAVTQKGLAHTNKKLALLSLLTGTDLVSSSTHWSELGRNLIVKAMLDKRTTVKGLCNSHPIFTEICLLKIYQIDFFDRELERSLLNYYINKFPCSGMNLPEDPINAYKRLLEELEKSNSKQSLENPRDAYKLSKEIEDFFISLGTNFTHLPTCEEYEKIISTSSLQPIFSKEEADIVATWLERKELKENSPYNTMLDTMFQSKLESSELAKKQEIAKASKSKKKPRATTNIAEQQAKQVSRKSTSVPLRQPMQSIREMVPIKKESIEKLLYPTHVTRWFTNPTNSLQDPKYTAIIQEWGKEACLYFHTFPTIIDELVGTEYSLQDQCDNKRTGQKDILYGIPGEIEIKGKSYRGFFQYIIDTKSGVCYHRCFNFRNKNFIQDLVQEKVWYPNDFPTLEQSKHYDKKKLDTFFSKEVTIQYDSVLQKIHIQTDAMNIVLFKGLDVNLMDEFVQFVISNKNKDSKEVA